MSRSALEGTRITGFCAVPAGDGVASREYEGVDLDRGCRPASAHKIEPRPATETDRGPVLGNPERLEVLMLDTFKKAIAHQFKQVRCPIPGLTIRNIECP